MNKYRLDVVPLNGCRRFGSGDKRCRRCGYKNETLPHVLCHCPPHQKAATLRHNNVQNRLLKAIPPALGVVTVNKKVLGSTSNLRPDIVIRDESQKRVIMIDVTCPFENGSDSFVEARAEKRQKYDAICSDLRRSGYQVFSDAFIIGALGSWDPKNERILNICHINKRYALLMRKLMVSDTIKWSRDIYVEHVSGVQQYTDR